MPLTKTLEIVMKQIIYDRIEYNDLSDDLSWYKVKRGGRDRGEKHFIMDNGKKDSIEFRDLSLLFSDDYLDTGKIKWEGWWNKGNKIVDISVLKSFSGIQLPTLENDISDNEVDIRAGARRFNGSDDDHNRELLFEALNYVRAKYRNPISHTIMRDQGDYNDCRDLLISGQKLFWILLAIIK